MFPFLITHFFATAIFSVYKYNSFLLLDIINVDNKYKQWFYLQPIESWEYVVETSGDMDIDNI